MLKQILKPAHHLQKERDQMCWQLEMAMHSSPTMQILLIENVTREKELNR